MNHLTAIMNSILVSSFVLLTQIPLSSCGIAEHHVDLKTDSSFLRMLFWLFKTSIISIFNQGEYLSTNTLLSPTMLLEKMVSYCLNTTNQWYQQLYPPFLCSSFDWVLVDQLSWNHIFNKSCFFGQFLTRVLEVQFLRKTNDYYPKYYRSFQS